MYVTPEIVTVLVPARIVPVSVPPRTPVPVFRLRVTFVLATTLEKLPLPSVERTTTAKPEPAVGFEPPLTEVMASLEAAAAFTVNGALLPAVRVSPLVRVAVRITPDSALVYVTPEIVTVLVPARIVPVSVPPRTPVPVFRLRVTFVLATTLAALPPAVCDCTTTAKAVPAVGFEPPLTVVMARVVATFAVKLAVIADPPAPLFRLEAVQGLVVPAQPPAPPVTKPLAALHPVNVDALPVAVSV